MGTRNLTIVLLNNEIKVAQYGQWDGYPSGQGKTIAKFLQANKERLGEFLEKVAGCSWLTDEEVEAGWIECGMIKGEKYVSMDVSNHHKSIFPERSRDTAANVLQMILDKGPLKLRNDYEFAADSLFCEYAYVVNMDTQSLEIYQGFNKSKLEPGERFYGMKTEEDSQYEPIRHLKTVSFNEVTPEFMDALEDTDNEE